MVERARLESVCTLIAYRGFESLSLRQFYGGLSVPPQREAVNPVRSGRKQQQQWSRVPGCGWQTATIFFS